MKIVRNIGAGFAISMSAARFMADRGCERAQKEIDKCPDVDDWFGFGYIEGIEERSPEKEGYYCEVWL